MTWAFVFCAESFVSRIEEENGEEEKGRRIFHKRGREGEEKGRGSGEQTKKGKQGQGEERRERKSERWGYRERKTEELGNERERKEKVMKG